MMMAAFAMTGLMAALWTCATASVLYLLVLLCAALLPRAKKGTAGGAGAVKSLAVLIPAHDEEPVLAATLHSLAAQTYPRAFYEVIVIADNCADATADIARALGATVLERRNLELRGKGYALEWALAGLLARPHPADAFVVVDADTWVAPDFLEKIIAHLPSEGFAALQGRYGVLNADDGWRAALMSAAFDLVNHVKPLGRTRLGLGAGLKGNGMAFTQALLRAAPWRGDSVTEDIDYALELARNHNVRVEYVPEAVVRAQMPTTARQAASQRDRWEGGRYHLLRERFWPLLREGLRRRSASVCDAAIDLAVPPLAELAALIALSSLLIALGERLHLLRHPQIWTAAACVPPLGLILYVLGGLRASGATLPVYLALARAPLYALWKFALYGARLLWPRRAPTDWVRTARTPIAPPAAEAETP